MIRTLAIALLAGTALFATPPSQSDLDGALAAAKVAWGIDKPVTIRLTDEYVCLPRDAQKPQKLAYEAAAVPDKNLAGFTHADAQTTTLTFDDPDTPPVITTSVTWIIEITQSCAWTHDWLLNVVKHEYGHALGVPHSDIKDSIMFWLVRDDKAVRKFGRQRIMDADRNAVGAKEASAVEAVETGRGGIVSTDLSAQ